VVEEFAGPRQASPRDRKKKDRTRAVADQPDSLELSAEAQALAERLRQWRTDEAKRLRVPPFVVMHDRTLTRIAVRRPLNPNQLLAIDGIGETKVEKFGAAILELCRSQ
jgi:superfamily II DNA helicase RecQ